MAPNSLRLALIREWMESIVGFSTRLNCASLQEHLARQEYLVHNKGMDNASKPKPIGLDALDLAISKVGLSTLADRMSVSYQLIQGWRKEGRKFATPAEYCRALAAASDGLVTEADLRPDVFGKIKQAA